MRVCPRTFHARFCATARTYRYRVRVAEAPPPVHEIGRVWHLATERVAGGGRARRGKVPEKHRTERTERVAKSVLRVQDVVTRMRLASEALAGADVDFSSFRAAGCQAKSPSHLKRTSRPTSQRNQQNLQTANEFIMGSS